MHPHFSTKVTCGLNGCPATPSSFEALRRHVYRYHHSLLNISSGASGEDSMEDSTGDESELAPISPFVAAQSLGQSSHTQSSSKLGAEFIMKIRDGKQLTQVVTEAIIDDAKIMLETTVENVQRAVIEKINATGTYIHITIENDHYTIIRYKPY